MKKVIILLAVALAIPTSVALAKANPTRGKSAPKVMYVLKGTLTDYTAATSSQDGQISIIVNHSNYHGRALKGQTVGPFAVTMNTKVTFKNGATTLSGKARGILKFRAPLRFTSGTNIAATLPTAAKALHIIDTARH
jgi:hypothetical protein